MMKSSIHNFTKLSILFVLTLVFSASALAESQSLFSVSGDNRTWICRNQPKSSDGERSQIFEKKEALGTDQKESWSESLSLPASIYGAARQGADLIIWHSPRSGEIFANSWAMIWKDQYNVGSSLPDRLQIAAMAGNEKSLYAIGLSREPDAAPVESAATQPATEPSTETQSASTYRPVLLKLGKNWTELAGDWPVDCPIRRNGDVSLVIIGGIPHALVKDQNNQFAILTHDGNNWSRQQTIPMPQNGADLPAGRRFKMLIMENEKSPVIWFGHGAGSAGSLWINSAWVSVPTPPGKTTPELTDLTITSDHKLMLYFYDGDRLMEQQLGYTGTPSGAPKAVTQFARKSTSDFNWLSLTVLAVLTVLIINSLFRGRQKGAEEEEDDDDNNNRN